MTYNGTRFLPGWPASCPWITAVGGTQVKANTSVTRPGVEEVWNEEVAPGAFFSGGGGFSDRFPTPSYQKKDVKNFLQNLEKTDPALMKHFNTGGVSVACQFNIDGLINLVLQRAFPDLSANAYDYFTFLLSRCSSPTRNHFVVAENGEFTNDSLGTSGAVPTIGSIITLVNDARIHAGKKPVGESNMPEI
jgi:tripeptidyl-peptidase-1